VREQGRRCSTGLPCGRFFTVTIYSFARTTDAFSGDVRANASCALMELAAQERVLRIAAEFLAESGFSMIEAHSHAASDTPCHLFHAHTEDDAINATRCLETFAFSSFLDGSRQISSGYFQRRIWHLRTPDAARNSVRHVSASAS
jgi:hypothetical protein